MLMLVIAAAHLDVTSGQAAVEAGLRYADIRAHSRAYGRGLHRPERHGL